MKESIKNMPPVAALRQVKKNYSYTRFIYNRTNQDHLESFTQFFKHNIGKTKVYFRKNVDENIFDCIRDAEISSDIDTFFYSIDPYKTVTTSGSLIHNFTVDYTFLLEHSIKEIGQLKGDGAKHFSDLLIFYVDKAIGKIKDSENANADAVILSLENMKTKPANGFFDALQRILFVNQLMWQTGHRLNGLGRLDKILEPYYEADLKAGNISKDKAYCYIKAFLGLLHRYFWYKSSMLMGDTGQIVILGGKRPDGSYFSNALTELFLKACEELKRPDPKILLRVSSKTPRELLELATDVIATGVGSPLISNDDVVIPAMIEYGYDEEDAYDYTVSACWKPTVAGKSAEVNNCIRLNFLNPLNAVLQSNNTITSYEGFETEYLNALKKEVDECINNANSINYVSDICLLVFSKDTAASKTISQPKYMSYGFTGTAFPNAVNSLLNIKKFVYNEKRFTLNELKAILASDFQAHEELKTMLRDATEFGKNKDENVALCNHIVDCVSQSLEGKTNKWGCHFKFGLSSPNYITDCTDYPASPDGRSKGEPFGVHISSVKPLAVTELLGFASKLDYLKAFNGDVVDFMVNPALIQNNKDKFVELVSAAIQIGVFQMQMNVVSSATLIAAREHPEQFPDLVVRVWGFSAYFKDLPDEYKDVLIQRALESEKAA